ncbi:AAA family ATPase [Tsukamurella soli]|uniref:MoxR family ATPase n=1 Tax=Tsukamurella soli TaxID=644556 RepID=A0ABP8JUT0_9ACTN
MTTRVQPGRADLDAAHRVVAAVSAAFGQKVVGQDDLRESLLVGLLAGGHVLLESVPGLAKTTAAKVLAESVGGRFQRIQCTPDLLPSDIIGTQIYEAATGRFTTRLGPVHANVVLLDEINRSSAKTQSAMLEAMEERQTTIAGEVHALADPFLVIATQNPIDQEGTYPLSEAQSDRFLIKEVLRYPTVQEEVEVMLRIDAGVYANRSRSQAVVGLEDVVRVQQIAAAVHMDPVLMRYAGEIVAATRVPGRSLPQHLARVVECGASPRATIALCRCARAVAVLAGRNHVIPDDIARVAHRVLRHRIMLGFEAGTTGVRSDDVVDAVLHGVRIP